MSNRLNPTRSARSAFQVCPNGTASNLKKVGKMTQNTALAATLAAGLCLAAPAAHASLITIALQAAGVNGGAITALANDGGTGSVTYAPSVSTYGTFSTNSISAFGAPILPQGSLSSNTIDASSSAAGTLKIWITEQGYTSPTGSGQFMTGLTSNFLRGGVTSVELITYINPANGLYGGTILSDVLFKGIGSSSITHNSPPLPGPYSLTQEYILTATGSGSTQDTISLTYVPEPASILLMGLGLAGLGVVRRKRRG